MSAQHPHPLGYSWVVPMGWREIYLPSISRGRLRQKPERRPVFNVYERYCLCHNEYLMVRRSAATVCFVFLRCGGEGARRLRFSVHFIFKTADGAAIRCDCRPARDGQLRRHRDNTWATSSPRVPVLVRRDCLYAYCDHIQIIRGGGCRNNFFL